MASKKDDIKTRLLATFRVEAGEHLEAISANLLALDRAPSPAEAHEVLETTFREVHTLKGAARSVSLMDVEALCQPLESLLGRLAREGTVPAPPLMNLLHEAVNRVARLLAGGEVEAALEELEAQARELLGDLLRDQRTITGAVDGLQEEMRLIRMTPASAVLALFPPMVRDLARGQGKEVEWVARGTDLVVDRKVLDAMKDPLVHLVRNAIDHGIELPEARERAGKPPRGWVAVTLASLERGRVEISVEDDGAGIDPARVSAAAVRARLLTAEEAQALTDEAALGLVVYRSGLSTSPIVTDLSGHGLGLAIVKERVERLGGLIHIETRVGAGTSVRMVLPTTIATFRGLLVMTGGQLFLLPIEAVERVIRIPSEAGQLADGREDWHLLSVVRLGKLLGFPQRDDQPGPGKRQPCVIVRSGDEQVGLLVEEVLGDREVLVKELRPPLVRVRNVSGAGLLGTGQVVLILRTADLLRSIREAPAPPGPPAAPKEEGPSTCVKRGMGDGGRG